MAKQNDLKFKLDIDSGLNRLLTNCTLFLNKYDSIPDKEYLNQLIYSHPIHKNKGKIEKILNIINESGTFMQEKVLEIKDNAIMKQKRKEELDQLTNFLNTDFKNILTNEPVNNKNILPLDEETKEKRTKTNDNFLIEDTTEDNKSLIGKKRKNSKNAFKFNCYICKKKLLPEEIHKFYGNLCNKCGDHNYSFRTLHLDLSGRIAIVTGGRVKIGYYIATKLLSYGCKVITTSRFPKDTLFKYKSDPDYEKWKDNLIIYPIDFRFFESTIKFINYIKDNFTHIDILINNAAQTIRRTSSYYKYLLPIETKELNEEEESKIIKNDYINLQNRLSQDKSKDENKNDLISLTDKEYKEMLPLSVIASQIKIMEEKNQPDINLIGNDGQAYDFSFGKNSWNLEFDEIPFQEFIEVQIINAWTPYYLCAKLKPLMLKSPCLDKYIVNVTAVEGIFNHFKRTTHVHTNMAKAGLNMFTRTCGKYLKNQNIYMTCVDTGWVSPMNELHNLLDKDKKEDYEDEFTSVPLDELDGAMRVLHPIIEGIKNKNYLYGILLKDYAKSDW